MLCIVKTPKRKRKSKEVHPILGAYLNKSPVKHKLSSKT